jgi:uncharacterized iron-regulated protein
MKKCLCLCSAMLALLTGCQAMIGPETLRLYDLASGKPLSETESLERLRTSRIVLVGEHHAERADHQAQLAVIEALHGTGRKVAIGLEMFRQDAQADLDRWVAEEVAEEAFVPIYLDNWNFDWELYQPIFAYARRHRLPMVGLNVPRELTRQVAYHGFDALSDAQKGEFGAITCNVTPQYRDYVREAYGAHPHGKMNFDHFCQAQLLWDTAMAMHAATYLEKNPDTVMVLLAGAGHTHKMGIPAQLDRRSPWPHVVLQPQTPGADEADQVTIAEADFLILPK